MKLWAMSLLIKRLLGYWKALGVIGLDDLINVDVSPVAARIIDDLSLYELILAVIGWNRAQGGEDGPPEMNADDYNELIGRHAEWIEQQRNPLTAARVV